MHLQRTRLLKNSWGWWWEQPPPNIQAWWRNQKNLKSSWEAVGKTRSGQSKLIVPFHYIWDWPLLVACGYGMGWAEALQRRQNPSSHAKHGKGGDKVNRKAKGRLHRVLIVLPLGPCLTTVEAEYSFKRTQLSSIWIDQEKIITPACVKQQWWSRRHLNASDDAGQRN